MPVAGATLNARTAAGLAALVALAAVFMLPTPVLPYRSILFFGAAAAAAGAGLVYLAWRADPAWTFSVALLAAPFTGKWEETLGLPSAIGLERLLLGTAIAAVLLRGPAMVRRGDIRLEPVHWVMLLLVGYATVSAAVSGTLLDLGPLAVLLERLGVFPFLAFLCASLVFRTEQQRRILLGTLVVLGAYLGLIALFETLGLKGLVWPAYIEDPKVGILPDRARGPFVEPATNGMALFTCAAASALALRTWRGGWVRLGASTVLTLCAAGLLFTLTRQVWAAALVATAVCMVVVPALRRWIPIAGLTIASAVLVLLATVPGLAQNFQERRTQQGTIDDRLNLNAAAFNVLEDRPLFGLGWQTFRQKNLEYFELSPDHQLTNVRDVPIHNVFLTYAAELGLIGVTLFVLALVLGMWTALSRRGPPELQPWRALLVGVLVFYLVIANFEFVQVFSTLVPWLLAGVVMAGTRRPETEAPPA